MAGPLYRQIADALRRKIEAGEFRGGKQLPTEDQLMGTYHASRNTVRGALKELTTRGLVHTLHGKGTFATEQVSPIITSLTRNPKTGAGGGEGSAYLWEVAAIGRSATAADPRVEIRKAGPVIASSLRIPEGTEVISRHQQRYVDGRPWSLQTSYYPRSLSVHAPQLLDTDNIPQGTVIYMAECGIHQAGYRDAIVVRAPDEEETDYFDLRADGHVQVVEISRVAFDQHQKAIRLTITAYRADRNRFVIDVDNVPGGEG
jgi:GntR family transcriptional regulator